MALMSDGLSGETQQCVLLSLRDEEERSMLYSPSLNDQPGT